MQIDTYCSVEKWHLSGNILLQYHCNVARLLLVTVTDYQKVGGSDRMQNCKHLVMESSDSANVVDRPTQESHCEHVQVSIRDCVTGYGIVACMDSGKIVRCRRTNLEARTISIQEARRQCGICRNPSHRHDMHFAATVVRGSSSASGPRGTQRLLRQAQ
jgi:hypothetical protein